MHLIALEWGYLGCAGKEMHLPWHAAGACAALATARQTKGFQLWRHPFQMHLTYNVQCGALARVWNLKSYYMEGSQALEWQCKSPGTLFTYPISNSGYIWPGLGSRCLTFNTAVSEPRFFPRGLRCNFIPCAPCVHYVRVHFTGSRWCAAWKWRVMLFVISTSSPWQVTHISTAWDSCCADVSDLPRENIDSMAPLPWQPSSHQSRCVHNLQTLFTHWRHC